MKNKPKEEFKWIYINNEKTNYKVSNKGYVISMNYMHTKKPCIMKEEVNHGYKRVMLCHNGKKYHKRIHRLVAESFIPNPNNKLEVNHIDGDKTNNNVFNLEWVTAEENKRHAKENDLIRKENNHPMNKLNKDVIENICLLLEKNEYSIPKIASMNNVSSGLVNGIYRGKLWKSISKKYNINNYHVRNKPKIDDEKLINKICYLLESHTPSEVSKILNIPYYVVKDIKNRRTYIDISKKYNF